MLLELDDLLFEGLRALPTEAQAQFAAHCQDSDHWCRATAKAKAAKAVKSKEGKKKKVGAEDKDGAEDRDGEGREGFKIVVPVASALALPSRPAPPADATPDALASKLFVLSGIFDGTGTGLAKGKAQLTKDIEAHGGKVVGAVSGKVTHLLIGREVGASKLTKARERDIKIINVEGLHALMRGEEAPDGVVESLSAGHSGNGLALRLTMEERETLMGTKRLTGPSDEPEAKRAKTETDDEEEEWARAEAEWETHRREKVMRYKTLRADGKRFYEVFGAEHGFYWLTEAGLAEFLARPTTSAHEEVKISTSFGAESNRGKRSVDEIDQLLAEGVEVDIDDRWW